MKHRFFMAVEDIASACVGPFPSAPAAFEHHASMVASRGDMAEILWVMRDVEPGFEAARAECTFSLTPAEDIAGA